DCRCAALIFEHPVSVGPVLDVLSTPDNSRLVYFSGGFGRSARRFENGIERSSHSLAVGLPGVGFIFLVNHLVFVADGRLTSFGDEVLYATVAGRRLLPFPPQLEIVKLRVSNDVAPGFTQAMEPAVFDDPTLGGERCLLET